MHKNANVPSTYNLVKYPLRQGQGILTADNVPFQMPMLIRPKHGSTNAKDVAGNEDVPVTVALGHPLARFTRPVTPLECERIKTYYHFEVLK